MDPEEAIQRVYTRAYTIALGNAFEGLTLCGVFDGEESAVEAAEDRFQGEDYRIIPVHTD